MNKFQPHVFVIPEDKADEDISNGFALHDSVNGRRIQVMPAAGGWAKVITTFEEEYVPRLMSHRLGHVVMVIDFDGHFAARMKRFQKAIPDELVDRVFVVGSLRTPEGLKAALNLTLEEIGKRLAQECADGSSDIWGHAQLQHNAPERVRLASVVQQFLIHTQG
jgi:hypothetical protein